MRKTAPAVVDLSPDEPPRAKVKAEARQEAERSPDALLRARTATRRILDGLVLLRGAQATDERVDALAGAFSERVEAETRALRDALLDLEERDAAEARPKRGRPRKDGSR